MTLVRRSAMNDVWGELDRDRFDERCRHDR